LNVVELEEGFNIFIINDDNTKSLLEKILDIKFFDGWAERKRLIMRKQIVPLLKEELGKNN